MGVSRTNVYSRFLGERCDSYFREVCIGVPVVFPVKASRLDQVHGLKQLVLLACK